MPVNFRWFDGWLFTPQFVDALNQFVPPASSVHTCPHSLSSVQLSESCRLPPECSAKTRVGVKEAFEELVAKVRDPFSS